MLSILLYVSGPSLEKCLFRSFAHFLNWIVCLPGVEFYVFFIYFGDKTLFQGVIAKYIFLYSWFLFHFLMFSWAMQKLFILIKSHLFILSFMSLTLGDILVKILLCGISEIFLPMFSSRTFMVLRLIFKPFIHLEFGVWCKLVVSFHFFAHSCLDLPTLFVEEDVILRCTVICQKPEISSWF